MKLAGLFDQRVRGFRIVELGGLGVLLVLVLAVYLAKTGAGGERANIDHVQQQIEDEQTRIRLLQAEVANLEQPERLEALSSHYLDLQPITAKREVQPDALPDIALTPLTAKAGQPSNTQAGHAPATVSPAPPPAQALSPPATANTATGPLRGER
jgi:cell division protein FtsL